MANPVVHFEIIGEDGPRLREFYSKAFGWEFTRVGGPVDYHLVQGSGIGGGIGTCPEGAASHVSFYVQVDDINAAIQHITSLGAKLVHGPVTVPGGAQIANFEDPTGHMVGVVQN